MYVHCVHVCVYTHLCVYFRAKLIFGACLQSHPSSALGWKPRSWLGVVLGGRRASGPLRCGCFSAMWMWIGGKLNKRQIGPKLAKMFVIFPGEVQT